jgi:hypothetical protein
MLLGFARRQWAITTFFVIISAINTVVFCRCYCNVCGFYDSPVRERLVALEYHQMENLPPQLLGLYGCCFPLVQSLFVAPDSRRTP